MSGAAAGGRALVVVTGASRGLGEAMVRQLLERGHPVVAAARGPAPEDLRGAAALHWSRVDLGEPQAAHDWIGTALAEQAAPGSAWLILNAGMLEPVVPAAALEPDALDRHMRVNLTGAMLVASGFLRASGVWSAERRIMAISSGAARRGIPYWGAYCAAKAGLDGFVRALNAERIARLRAVSMAPGVVDTAMQTVLRGIEAPGRERFERLHREGGLVAPADAAAALLRYLAADGFGDTEIDDIRNAA